MTTLFSSELLDQLMDEVLASSKYRHLPATLVRALGADELAKRRKLADAVKATKNKLHQIAGAYQLGKPDYAAWLATLRAAPDGAAQRTVCTTLMAHHASTRERLTMLADFYTTLFAGLPPITRLLDLACGLNPLARPWMPLAADAHYLACDLYDDQMAFLQEALLLLGGSADAFVWDLLQGAPPHAADVALLLKTIPCLEQVDKTIGARLLATVNAPVLIVSFPVQSLGGRQKGMAVNYERHFGELVAGQPWRIDRFSFVNELIFRVVR